MECPITHWTADDQANFLNAWHQIGEISRNFDYTSDVSFYQFLTENLRLWRVELFFGFLTLNHPIDSLEIFTRMGARTAEHYHFFEGIRAVLGYLRLQRQFHLSWDDMHRVGAWAASVWGDN